MKRSASDEEIRSSVRQHYGQIAENFQPEGSPACCSPNQTACCPSPAGDDHVTSNFQPIAFYEVADVVDLPADVAGLSLGCGDPITLAGLQPGQTVLDLGAGGGIDCFLAARRVGAQGRVIGVDMTPAMLEKARANQQKLGVENVEFRLGEIEHLPVADASVDVIISNCVINLSPDKEQVFREAYRVLRPGGKLAVSDIVTRTNLPEVVRASLSAWAGCVAGALPVQDYVAGLEAAGFIEVQVAQADFDSGQDGTPDSSDGELAAQAVELISKLIFSARITALKPTR